VGEDSSRRRSSCESANAPVTVRGGVKDSGYGREGGTEGLSYETVVKNVSHLMM
jgi:succinate-semialdehyde dehydrogenase / glutarate-semialdehyde dehydrogenase